MQNAYRCDQIYTILLHKESATVEELANTFHVTPTTIRRDLLYMESKKLVVRTRGAVYLPHGAESEGYNPTIFLDEKRRIAKVAATYMNDKMSVAIDSGTTTVELIDYLLEQDAYPNMNIVTYSPAVALKAANKYRVSIPGGSLMPHSDFIVGNDAEKFFSEVNVDLAILSSTGVYNCNGLTVSYPLQLAMKKQAAACASKRIAVLDSGKYFNRGIYTFCDFHDLDILITIETEENKAELERISHFGVEIVTA